MGLSDSHFEGIEDGQPSTICQRSQQAPVVMRFSRDRVSLGLQSQFRAGIKQINSRALS